MPAKFGQWMHAENLFAGLGVLSLFGTLAFVFVGPRDASGGLAATAAVFFALWQFSRNKRRETSAMLLETAVECHRVCVEILENDEATRINWILAARTVGRGMEAAKQVTEPDHLAYYHATVEPYRIRIRAALTNRPIEFFWCETNLDGLPSDPRGRTDACAKCAYKHRDSSDFESHGSTSYFEYHSIAALALLYEASRPPEDYGDPLDGMGEGDWWPPGDDWVSLRSYAQFHRRYHVLPNGPKERADYRNED